VSGRFTPGPWEACNDRGWRIWSDRAVGSTPVATVAWPDNTHRITSSECKAEAEANARLIAAAPELLEAAETVLAGLNERIDEAAASGGESVPVFAGIADLHAALAKALGTTPNQSREARHG
jgi:hypothetical protein